MKLIKKRIEVSFDKITAKQYYTGVVASSGRSKNVTSARINVHKDFIGKKVIIIILDDANQEKND